MNNSRILYLIEDINKHEDILKILTLNNTLTIEKAELTYYTELANWAFKNRTSEKNIDLNTIELSDKKLIGGNSGIPARTNTLLGILNAIDTKLTNKLDASNETSRKIQKLTVEILAALSGIKNPKSPTNKPKKVEDSEDQKYPEGKIDWTAYKAKQLAEASKNGKTVSKVLDEFYEFYYRKEYAGLKSAKELDKKGIVTKLKSLDKILIIEFNKLGYNPEVNPFAQFLKLLIKQPDMEIFNKLNTNNYGAIHNSFIDQSITGNKLGNYNDKNILFCRDLYNYKGLDIVNYLSLYSQVVNSAKTDTRFSDDPELLVSKIFIQQKQLDDDYTKNIEQLLAMDAGQVVLPGRDKSAKMRSYTEISEIYLHLFKTAAKQKIDRATADKISDEAEKDGISKDMIKYLIDIDVLPDKTQEEYEQWFNKINYKPNDTNKKACKQRLSGYLIQEASSALNLIKRLRAGIEAAGKREEPNEEKKDEKKS